MFKKIFNVIKIIVFIFLFLAMIYIEVVSFSPNYQFYTTKNQEFILSEKDSLEITNSSKPVNINIINIENFSVETEINNETTSYESQRKGNLYEVNLISQPNTEYSTYKAKFILSSEEPFTSRINSDKLFISDILFRGMIFTLVELYLLSEIIYQPLKKARYKKHHISPTNKIATKFWSKQTLPFKNPKMLIAFAINVLGFYFVIFPLYKL